MVRNIPVVGLATLVAAVLRIAAGSEDANSLAQFQQFPFQPIPCPVTCEYCGCEGSYVGRNCVCQCPDGAEERMACLSAIRNKELRAGIDNDILILTATGGRFARDLSRMNPPKQVRKNKRKKYGGSS